MQNLYHLSFYLIYQALRICLEWSSEAVYFSTHHLEVIYQIFFFLTNRSIVYKLNHLGFFCRLFFTIVGFWRFCLLQKPSLKIYIKKKSFLTLNLKCITCKKKTCFKPINNFLCQTSWNDRKCIFHKNSHMWDLQKH